MWWWDGRMWLWYGYYGIVTVDRCEISGGGWEEGDV